MKPTLLLSFYFLKHLKLLFKILPAFIQRHRSKFTLELWIGFDSSSISSNVRPESFLSLPVYDQSELNYPIWIELSAFYANTASE